jgi:hypothetical protein
VTFTDQSSTEEYRDRLEQALAIARRRLNAREFDTLAHGIEAEIRRLDLELSNQVVVFRGALANSWAALSAQSIVMNTRSPIFIRFNSPRSLAPWSGPTKKLPASSDNTFVLGRSHVVA